MNFGQPPMAGASLWLELAQAIDAVTAAVADCGSGAKSAQLRIAPMPAMGLERIRYFHPFVKVLHSNHCSVMF